MVSAYGVLILLCSGIANKSDISYLKNSRAFDVLIYSSQTLLVSDSVGTTSSCLLLAFPLLVKKCW